MKLPRFRYTRGTWVERLAWAVYLCDVVLWHDRKTPNPPHRCGVFRWYAEGAGGGD